MKTEPRNLSKEDNTILLSKSTKFVHVSNKDAFMDGFTKLATENISTITYNAFGIVTIIFKDGTSCGGLVPWIEAKFIDKVKYNEKYGTQWKMTK